MENLRSLSITWDQLLGTGWVPERGDTILSTTITIIIVANVQPQNYLDSLVEVDDDLGGVAAEEDHHDRHQQARHRPVPEQLVYHIYFNIQRTEKKNTIGDGGSTAL